MLLVQIYNRNWDGRGNPKNEGCLNWDLWNAWDVWDEVNFAPAGACFVSQGYPRSESCDHRSKTPKRNPWKIFDIKYLAPEGGAVNFATRY